MLKKSSEPAGTDPLIVRPLQGKSEVLLKTQSALRITLPSFIIRSFLQLALTIDDCKTKNRRRQSPENTWTFIRFDRISFSSGGPTPVIVMIPPIPQSFLACEFNKIDSFLMIRPR